MFSVSKIGSKPGHCIAGEIVKFEFVQEDGVVDDIKGGAEIEEQGSTQLLGFCLLNPIVIYLGESCCSGMIGPKTMVIGMPEIVGGKMFCNLLENRGFCQFTYKYKVRSGSSVSTFGFVTLLEMRRNFVDFPELGVDSASDG